MKKVIIVIGILVLLAGGAMPLINGMIMEKIARQTMTNVNEMNLGSGSDVKVEISSFDRGFSSSTIEWRIDFGILSTLYGVDEIVFVETATHGYGGVVSETRLDRNPWFNDLINLHLSGKNPIHIKTEYPIFGKITSTVTVDGFSIEDGEDIFYVEPASIVLSLDKQIRQVQSLVHWQGGEVPGKMKIGRISVSSAMEKITPFIWDGRTTLELDSFKVDDQSEQFEVKKALIETSQVFDRDQNALTLNMGIGVDQIIEHGSEMLQNAYVQIGLHRMDAAAYENLAKTYTQMMNAIMKELPEKGFDPDTMNEVMKQEMAGRGMQLLAEAEKFLKKGFGITISDLNATLPQGKVNGRFNLTLKRDMTMAGFAPVMMKPSLALDIFTLDSKLSLPAELVRNPSLTQPFYPGMQTGLFVRQEEMLTHKAETREGKLFVNSKEVVWQ